MTAMPKPVHSLLAARKSRRAAAQNLRQKGLSGAQIEQAL